MFSNTKKINGTENKYANASAKKNITEILVTTLGLVGAATIAAIVLNANNPDGVFVDALKNNIHTEKNTKMDNKNKLVKELEVKKFVTSMKNPNFM